MIHSVQVQEETEMMIIRQIFHTAKRPGAVAAAAAAAAAARVHG